MDLQQPGVREAEVFAVADDYVVVKFNAEVISGAHYSRG